MIVFWITDLIITTSSYLKRFYCEETGKLDSLRLYQPRKVSLDETHAVSWQYSLGEGKPLVTKTLPPAPYPGYYSVFEHVTDALVHDLAEIQIESNYQPTTRKV